MLFRRLPVDTFVFDVIRMVLFSSLGPDPVPAIAPDGIGTPFGPEDRGAAFVAGIKLGLFVISLLLVECQIVLETLIMFLIMYRLTLSSSLVYCGLASLV